MPITISTEKNPPKDAPSGVSGPAGTSGTADAWTYKAITDIRREVDAHMRYLHDQRVNNAEQKAIRDVSKALQNLSTSSSGVGFRPKASSPYDSIANKFLQSRAFGYEFNTGSQSDLGIMVRESAALHTETESFIVGQRQHSNSGEILYQLDLLRLSIAHADTLALGDNAMVNSAIHLLRSVNSTLAVMRDAKSLAEDVGRGLLKSVGDYASILRTGIDPDTGEEVTYTKFMWKSLEWFGPEAKALGVTKLGAAQLYAALGAVLSKGGKTAKLAGPVREAIARASKSMSEMLEVRDGPVGKVFDLARERGQLLLERLRGGFVGVGKGPNSSNYYRELFFSHYPEAEGKVVVHHAVEWGNAEKRFPGLFTREELQSIENLRGIPLPLNNKIHLSEIRKEWNVFYLENENPSREQIFNFARQIDDKFGHLFLPEIR